MNPYVLAFKHSQDIVEEFKKIGVDWAGIEIMRKKGVVRCVKICHLRNFVGNILKQEMLSLGGDAALSRGTLTGQAQFTDCLLLGNSSQILSLAEKLKIQPFGLPQLGAQIKSSLINFEKEDVVLDLAGKRIKVGRRTLIMGIINASFDSFSNDSIFGMTEKQVSTFAQNMVSSGADILDIGGESTRPGSKIVPLKEELKRVIPVIKLLRKHIRVPLSIDTTKSDVAKAALDLGVKIVNDISALRFDKKMASLAARYKASVVLMHMRGKPSNMQNNTVYKDVVGEVFSFLASSLQRAREAGIAEEKLILDPGIGFGKGLAHNIELIKNLSVFKSLGRPIMVGVSRKSFIGQILKSEPGERAWGSAAAVCASVMNGANIIRVHDVKEIAQVVKVVDNF